MNYLFNMSKETILKEFDEKFNWEEIFGKNSKAQQSLRELLSKAIDQTREETIKEVEEMLPKKVIGANLDIEKILNKLK